MGLVDEDERYATAVHEAGTSQSASSKKWRPDSFLFPRGRFFGVTNVAGTRSFDEEARYLEDQIAVL
jgi:hypothetical protein